MRCMVMSSGGPRSGTLLLMMDMGVLLLDSLKDSLGLVRLLEYRVDVRQVDSVKHPVGDPRHPSPVEEVHVRVHFAFQMNY
jgi:hypothetical protein